MEVSCLEPPATHIKVPPFVGRHPMWGVPCYPKVPFSTRWCELVVARAKVLPLGARSHTFLSDGSVARLCGSYLSLATVVHHVRDVMHNESTMASRERASMYMLWVVRAARRGVRRELSK